MKRTTALIIAFLLCFDAFSQQPVAQRKVAARIEWGGAGGFFMARHFNYICSEGYRVNDEDMGMAGAMNAYFLAGVQTSIGNCFDVAFCLGTEGVWSGRNNLACEICTDWCPRGVTSDGPIMNLAAGAGLSGITPLEMQTIVRLGGGYRFALGNRSGLDFLAGIRGIWDHPSVKDPDTGEYVPGQDVRRNNAVYAALTFSIALNF